MYEEWDGGSIKMRMKFKNKTHGTSKTNKTFH